jgi:hypothetical protein
MNQQLRVIRVKYQGPRLCTIYTGESLIVTISASHRKSDRQLAAILVLRPRSSVDREKIRQSYLALPVCVSVDEIQLETDFPINLFDPHKFLFCKKLWKNLIATGKNIDWNILGYYQKFFHKKPYFEILKTLFFMPSGAKSACPKNFFCPFSDPYFYILWKVEISH